MYRQYSSIDIVMVAVEGLPRYWQLRSTAAASSGPFGDEHLIFVFSFQVRIFAPIEAPQREDLINLHKLVAVRPRQRRPYSKSGSSSGKIELAS